MMGIAEKVNAGELEVGFPVIVTETAVKVFQHSHGFDGVAAAFGVREEQRPLIIAKAV